MAHEDERVASSAASTCGWLEKQAEWKLAWNPRYFNLCGTSISYREEDATSDKKCAEVKCLQRHITGAPNTFRIWTDRGGCWVLRCASSEDHLRWTNAIADVLGEDHPDEVLTGTVQKCSSWTKVWRSRHLQLDGLKLAYSEKEGAPVKNRYVIASADATLTENEVRVTVTTGEWFLLRFRDSPEAKLWLATIRAAQRRMHTLRWQAIHTVGDGTWYCGANGHAASNFEGKHVVLFGGSATMPNQSKALQRELVLTSLVGAHPSTVVHPAPFDEAANAKVRPSPRERAASTLLVNGVFILYGGSTGSPVEVLCDGWAVNVAARSGWLRFHDDKGTKMPRLFGHTMHPVNSSLDTFLVVGGIDPRFTAQADVYQCTLSLSGGPQTDVTVTKLPPLDQPRALHAGVELPDGTTVLVGGCHGRYHGVSDDKQGAAGALPPQPPVDASPSRGSAHTTLSVRHSGSDHNTWRSVPLTPPLPMNTLCPAACAHGSTIFVWCRSEGGSPEESVARERRSSVASLTAAAAHASASALPTPVLMGITFSTEFALVTQYLTRGDVPSITRGLSMHMSEDYCYLFGASEHTVHRVLPPCGPHVSAAVSPSPSTSSGQ